MTVAVCVWRKKWQCGSGPMPTDRVVLPFIDIAGDASPALGAPMFGRGGTRSAYTSTRRALQIVDRVSRAGEGLTVKALARDLGVSLSTCYHLVRILIDEGYIERLTRQRGYRLGPTVGMLSARSRRSGSGPALESVLRQLARCSHRAAYFAVLSERDEVVVAHAHYPLGCPPIGVPPGFFGPAHALALGKALIAAGGSRAIARYIEQHELHPFTDRTITDPRMLEAHLQQVRVRGYATEFEEFARNLCFVAVAVIDAEGSCSGAVGLGTVMTRRSHELQQMIGLVRRASRTITVALRDTRPRGRAPTPEPVGPELALGVAAVGRRS